ncbi:MAG: hypothetical protein LBE27_02400, partial [Deltaproteobacteria bacterium]|nr:hypothetical protein [Deltaproteobacteria bacterium]
MTEDKKSTSGAATKPPKGGESAIGTEPSTPKPKQKIVVEIIPSQLKRTKRAKFDREKEQARVEENIAKTSEQLPDLAPPVETVEDFEESYEMFPARKRGPRPKHPKTPKIVTKLRTKKSKVEGSEGESESKRG